MSSGKQKTIELNFDQIKCLHLIIKDLILNIKQSREDLPDSAEADLKDLEKKLRLAYSMSSMDEEIESIAQKTRPRPGANIKRHDLILSADEESEVEYALKMNLRMLDDFFNDPGYQKREKGFSDSDVRDVLDSTDLCKESLAAIAISQESENEGFCSRVTLAELEEIYRVTETAYSAITYAPQIPYDGPCVVENVRNAHIKAANLLLSKYKVIGAEEDEISNIEHQLERLKSGLDLYDEGQI